MKHAVWLHVHVPKAGGSTLRQLMNRNFGKGYYNSNSLLETKQYTREDVSEIIRCHPWVRCFSDHKLSLDLPYHHENADVYAISFVRDPVERFVSRYFFHRHHEEVACIAQRMSFRDFANAELVQQYVHPQTNSQIYFLNGGRSLDDLSVIHQAIETGRAFLLPIERFDEACICLEQLFPEFFTDLSYVRTNVSKKDEQISPEDRDFVFRYLKTDMPVFDLANQQMDLLLARAFRSVEDSQAALAEFQERCSRRFHNFHPPRPRDAAPPEPADPADPSPPANPADPAEPTASAKPGPSETKPSATGSSAPEALPTG